MDEGGSLWEEMTTFLERGTNFLQFAGAFRGGVFGYEEVRPLRKRRVAKAQEGRGLTAEEESGMVSKSDICP